jgi:hypothetical protein
LVKVDGPEVTMYLLRQNTTAWQLQFICYNKDST